ncbi:MAG: hypothetical protein WA412_02825, partial [Candidatus Sulfotelmatobacter sp.]
ASFLPVPVREFLHQFVTILPIKIGQWLGTLHAAFAPGLFSHRILLCCQAQKLNWDDLLHHAAMD